jgi:hypothetical protein
LSSDQADRNNGCFYFGDRAGCEKWALASLAGGVTLAKARQLAAEARGHLAKGEDPVATRIHAQREAIETPKFGEYALSLIDGIEGGFSNLEHRQQWRNTLVRALSRRHGLAVPLVAR